ncbi:hypothetical protein A3Q56_00204 [Intoshia linei]|uniref:Endothelin-converting enzyme 1 n=1 Tax=Intoshia linei TaxID=1819745 RepID=A0A177BEN5_9BILA|nr:hypothetical protein A3Q56_00204 [Intoshia linei]
MFYKNEMSILLRKLKCCKFVNFQRFNVSTQQSNVLSNHKDNIKFNGILDMKQLRFSYMKSSSPGGSNANAVKSKVSISFNVNNASFLNDSAKGSILKHADNYINKNGELHVTSQIARSAILNQADCLKKLRTIIWDSIKLDEIVEESPQDEELIEKRKERNKLKIVKLKEHRSFNHRMKKMEVNVAKKSKPRKYKFTRTNLSFAIIILILIGVIIASYIIKFHQDIKICSTDECFQLSAHMSSYMDKSVDPCDNFYEHACGNFAEDHGIPPNFYRYSAFTILTEYNKLLIRKKLLEDNHTYKNKNSSAILYIKSFFEKCTNSYKHTNGFYLQFLGNIGGYFSFDDRFHQDGINLEHIIATTYNQTSTTHFFSFNVMISEQNNNEHVINLSSITLQFSKYYYNNETVRNIYAAYIIDSLIDMGYTNTPFSVLNQTATNIVNIEHQLSNINSFDHIQNPKKTFTRFNLSHLANIIDMLDVKKLFNYVYPNINDNVMFETHTVPFLKNVNYMLYNVDERSLNDYILWTTFTSISSFYSEKQRLLKSHYNYQIRGKMTELSRWSTCLTLCSMKMPIAAGAAFVDTTKSQKIIEKTQKMISNLKQEFKKRISSFNWISEKMTEKISAKISSIIPMIYQPDFLNTTAELDYYYKDFNYDPDDSFLDLFLKITHHNSDLIAQTLILKTNKNRWLIGSSIVNAYYTGTINRIVLPAGILSAPFFYSDIGINSVNYGAMGMIISHELTHSIDNVGGQYNQDGSLINWWDADFTGEFNKRKDCIINHFNDYTIDGVQLNGTNTVSENIADLGGIKLAFQTVKTLKQKSEEDVKLIGFSNATYDQIFFLSFAQIWCHKYPIDAYKIMINHDNHSPPHIRVNAVLRNTNEFSNAFNCKVNSPMNPEQKCELCYKMDDKKGVNSQKSVYIFFIVILLVSLIAILIYYNIGSKTCLTNECLSLNVDMNSYMNRSVDPCENFYEYSCGNYKNVHKGLKYYNNLNNFEQIKNEHKYIIRQKLLQNMTNYNETLALKKMSTFYLKCLNHKDAPPDYYHQLLNTYGSYYSFDTRFGHNLKLEQTMAKSLNMTGMSSFFQFYINEESEELTINIFPISMNLKNSTLFLLNYKKYIFESFINMGYTNTSISILNDTANKISLLTDSIDQIKSNSVLKDIKKNVKKYNLKQISNVLNFINFEKYFNYLFPNINKKYTFEVYDLKYFENLNKLLKQTQQKDLLNYVLWDGFFSFAPYYNQKQMILYTIFKNSILANKSGVHNYCLDLSIRQFPLVAGSAFLKTEDAQQIIEDIDDMYNNTRNSFIRIINKSSWVKDETKQKIIDKVLLIKPTVIQSKFLLNKTLIESYYKRLELKPKNTFLESFFKVHQFIAQKCAQLFSIKNYEKKFIVNTHSAEAFYMLKTNAILLSYGILHPPFYYQNVPMASVNYGKIGMVIGHEISHSIDTIGSQYNENGVLENWLDDEFKDEFNKRKVCIVDHYTQFINTTTPMNSTRTSSENFSDINGVTVAFKALLKALNRKSEPKLISYKNFTPQQIFFISYAQNWCNSHNFEIIENRRKLNSHSPMIYRYYIRYGLFNHCRCL